MKSKEAKKLNKAIGAEVKRIRKGAGIRQTALAPILGLDQSALSRVESGRQELSAAEWVVLCAHTGTSCGFKTRIMRKRAS